MASIQDSPAQTAKDPSVDIRPENDKFLYRAGETAVLNVDVLRPKNISGTLEVTYKLSLNGVTSLKEGAIRLEKDKGSIEAKLDQPGFILCNIRCAIGEDTHRRSAFQAQLLGVGLASFPIVPPGIA